MCRAVDACFFLFGISATAFRQEYRTITYLHAAAANMSRPKAGAAFHISDGFQAGADVLGSRGADGHDPADWLKPTAGGLHSLISRRRASRKFTVNSAGWPLLLCCSPTGIHGMILAGDGAGDD
jgi:hypothetical protein